MRFNLTGSVAAMCAGLVVRDCRADDPAAEVLVGRDASGRLAALVGFPMPYHLPRSVFPGFPGFAAGLPGFESLDFDRPGDGVFVLSAQADIEMLLVSSDAGIGVLNDTGSGFMAPGETYHFGPAFFDFHPLWNIPKGEHGEVFGVTVVFRDRSGIHSDSEPLVLTLTPAECAGDFNDDGEVNTADLVMFLGWFGGSYEHGEPGHAADSNHDGSVNTLDLITFLGRFGHHC